MARGVQEIRLVVGGADVGVHQIVLVPIRTITKRHSESPPIKATPGLLQMQLRSGVITEIRLENRVSNDGVDVGGHAHPHLSTESHFGADYRITTFALALRPKTSG